MEDQGAGLAELPAAIGERGTVIDLQEPKPDHVVVKKFSLVKSKMFMDWIVKLFQGASEEERKSLDLGDTTAIALFAVQKWGDKVNALLQLCVRTEDAGKISDEILLEDAVRIVAAAIELNLSETLKKNAGAIWAAIRRLLEVARTSTPSSPRSA